MIKWRVLISLNEKIKADFSFSIDQVIPRLDFLVGIN